MMNEDSKEFQKSDKRKTPKPSYLREVQIRFKKKRVKSRSPVGDPIISAQQVYELFQDLQNETKKKLITISLDIKLKIISFEIVAIGAVASVYARPFEAIRSSVALNAYGVILVHNHPSGDPAPSGKDTEFTQALKEVTKLGGMQFYDHIIIGDDDYFSFANNGMI